MALPNCPAVAPPSDALRGPVFLNPARAWAYKPAEDMLTSCEVEAIAEIKEKENERALFLFWKKLRDASGDQS